MLAQTIKWNSLTNAIKAFYVPDIFIFVLDITLPYIVLLGEYSINMLYALKLRSVGVNKEKSSSLAAIGGTIFLKSKEMADEMYQAMECRGFCGEYKVRRIFGVTFLDLSFIIVNVVFILAFFML